MTSLRAFRINGRATQQRDGGRADFLKPVPDIDFSRVTEDILLRNQFVRLNTLYKIVNKDGVLQDFTMNEEQYDWFTNKHNKNIVLKARQRGFTTVIQLFLLDTALFNPNKSCGVIAHNKEDAEKFFDKKIKLAYEHIPADFKKKWVPDTIYDRDGLIKFTNGSNISVGTSMRSDTLQYLHISEFGKLCAKFPDKAAEVVSGALNTVSVDSWVTIESTGEGSHGEFYDMCEVARDQAERGDLLSPMDYKFFFYPWWTARDYRLNIHQEPREDHRRYFTELEKTGGIVLSRYQKNWYIAKQREQKHRMWREYPSTPDESFRGIIDGAPLSRIMAALRARGRITSVPWARGYHVHTFWDLGRNDKTAIWFMQHIGFDVRFFDYFEDNLRPLSDYATILNEKGYTYGTHHLPHDADNIELSRTDAKSRREILEDLLDTGDCIVIERIETEEAGVNATRENMDNCWFDRELCAKGVQCLENVRYRFDDKLQEFQPNLMRTQFKHGYDAFAQYGHGYNHRQTGKVAVKHSTQGRELARGHREPEAKKRRASAAVYHTEQTRWKT